MESKRTDCCFGFFSEEKQVREKRRPLLHYGRRLLSGLRQTIYFIFDVRHAFRNDPALRGKAFAFLELATYSGIWAMFFHRISHLLFVIGIPFLPRLLSQISRFLTGIEIHPGARIGRGLFIDHGNGVVIGETAVIGDNVLMYHQVTLGSRGGTEAGKRHPTVGNDVVIGAGARLLGAIRIGDDTVIGAGTVVLKDIPAGTVVIGNPARVLRKKTPSTISLPSDISQEKLID